MGREIKRVPLDWDWPLNERWEGFLSPDDLDGLPCPECGDRRYTGCTERVNELHNLWYGNAPFRPEDNQSTPLTEDTPAVRRFAERNVAHAPEFYGSDELSIRREARRLARLWNGMWMHHLNDHDVAVLREADALPRDLTHTWDGDRELGERWQRIEPAPEITAAMLNEMTISRGLFQVSFGPLIEMYCKAEGDPMSCPTCDGHGSIEAYPGQRADSEAWEPTEPPTGEGWQLWETVSEGSPISPVFPDAEGLAQWLTTPASCWGATKRPMTIEQARGFVGAGWAPSGFVNAGGVHDGAEYIGTEEALRGHGI